MTGAAVLDCPADQTVVVGDDMIIDDDDPIGVGFSDDDCNEFESQADRECPEPGRDEFDPAKPTAEVPAAPLAAPSAAPLAAPAIATGTFDLVGWAERLVVANRQVAEAKVAALEARETANQLKKSFDAAVGALLLIVTERAQWEKKQSAPLPLFDPAPDDTVTPAATDPTPTLVLPAGAAPTNGAGDDWRSAPLLELGLPNGLVAKLAEQSVTTIGDLEALRARISNHEDAWPKGVGPAKITLIEDAVVNWLSQHRDSEVLAAAAAPLPKTAAQPSDSAAYRSGGRAFYDGVPSDNNPYDYDTTNHGEWLSGWEDECLRQSDDRRIASSSSQCP